MISVIMSTFNRGHDIERSVMSILNQTYKDFEFIICDDASTDDTYDILINLSKLDDRIVVIKNKQNQGLQKSLNRCIGLSQGEYIARMDDDDYSVPGRFSKEIYYLEKTGSDFVGSNIDFYSDDRGVYGEKLYSKHPSNVDLVKSCPFCHPTILISSEVLRKVGLYSESQKHYRVEDYELWLRLYSLGYTGYNIQEKLLIYTKDANSINNIKKIDRINCYRLLKEYFKRLSIPKKYYFFVVLPILKMFIPSYLRKVINYRKYSN